MTGYKRGYK